MESAMTILPGRVPILVLKLSTGSATKLPIVSWQLEQVSFWWLTNFSLTGWRDCLLNWKRISRWQLKQRSGSLATNSFSTPLWTEWQLSHELPAALCLFIFQNANVFVSSWQVRHLANFSLGSSFLPKVKIATPLPPPFSAC